MADPLTALMYVVQVMNFVKRVILRTLRERKDCVIELSPGFCLGPFDENGDHILFESYQQDDVATENQEAGENFVYEKIVLECSSKSLKDKNSTKGQCGSLIGSSENLVCDEDLYYEFPPKGNTGKSNSGQSSNSCAKKVSKKTRLAIMAIEKKGISNLSLLDSRSERIKARQ